MASQVDIANAALMKLGAESIVALSDDNERARACNAAWPLVRREVLRAHSWNVPVARATLAATNDTINGSSTFGFDTAYNIPADCIYVIEVDTEYDWRVEGRQILTDGNTSIHIRYAKDETDPEQYDPALTAVMASRLAAEIAYRITDSATMRDRMWQEYEMQLERAAMADATEQSPADFEEDDWITVRN